MRGSFRVRVYPQLLVIFTFRCGCRSGSDRGGALGLRHTEHRLALLALHELAANLIRNGENLSATKVWANDLASHDSVSPKDLSAMPDGGLEIIHGDGGMTD